jgi:EAL domain-containing protein (putative c-di-GMP-specific phosphodiesterase class I)
MAGHLQRAATSELFLTDSCEAGRKRFGGDCWELAHRLDLTTVAEGVENAMVEKLMVEIGFDLLQGFHLAKPTREAALLDLLRECSVKPFTPEPVGPRLTGLAT